MKYLYEGSLRYACDFLHENGSDIVWWPLTSEYVPNFKRDNWNFDLHPLYNLKSAITEFRYDQSFEEMILAHASHVDLLEISLITNNSNATLEQMLENEIKRTKETTTSWSMDIVNGADAHVEASFSFGSLFHAGASADYHFSKEEFNGKEHRESEEVTYRISKKVTVPPLTSLKIVSYVTWINNLELPFTAKLEIGAIGPVPNKEGTLFTPRSVELKAVKSLMDIARFRDNGAASKYEDTLNKKMVYMMNGMFKGSFGLNTVFDAEPIDKEEAERLAALLHANGKSHKVMSFK